MLSTEASDREIREILGRQKRFFESGRTFSIEFRENQLRRLAAAVKSYENELLGALKADLHKPRFEAYLSEVGFVIEDAIHSMKSLKKWSRPRRVGSKLLLFPARGEILREPYGTALIIAPWNYPVQLLLSPLVGAIAAGNTSVLKPSELTPRTEAVLAKLVRETFDAEYIAVVTGGREVAENLLLQKFDFIFFTGSPAVGRVVMQAASKFLTPVCLELGGKSPCIVDNECDLNVAARRISWGKFFNAGQTCVAPDYVLVQASVKDVFLEEMRKHLVSFYGEQPETSEDYGRIVNARHFHRLTSLLSGETPKIGGRSHESSLFIEPTVLDGPSWDSAVMKDEIFGPILPVLAYKTLDDAIRTVNSQPKPLALYLFSTNAAHQERVMREVSFGGGCINDCIAHLGNPELPFGGVGESGMGAYHGKYSFDIFSHTKSVLRNGFWFDPDLRYPPYSMRRLGWIRRIMEKGTGRLKA